LHKTIRIKCIQRTFWMSRRLLRCRDAKHKHFAKSLSNGLTQSNESRNRFYFQSSRNNLLAFSQASTFTNCFFRHLSRNKPISYMSYVIRILHNMHILIIFNLFNWYHYFFMIIFLFRLLTLFFYVARSYCMSADS
jgi:hypothetical protein